MNADEINDPGLPGADIRRHISQLSKVTGPHRHTQFVPLKGPGREELDRMQKYKKVPTPRNLKLYDDDSDKSSGNVSYTSDDYFDENELRATLRSTLGGENYSNRRIEERWRNPQKSARDDPEKAAKMKPKRANDKLFANNVLMSSIVNHHQEVNGDAALNFNQKPENVGGNSCNFNLVADSIEPDFFYRKIGNSQQDDDFIVEHIGKITTVTPRQFFIHDIEPEHFAFSKKKKQ